MCSKKSEKSASENFGCWVLTKYAKWDDGNWKMINSETSKQLLLVLKDMQLLVLQSECVLESMSVTIDPSHLKCLYNSGTLVFAIRQQENQRRFRVLFSSLLEAERCVVELRRYIEITIQGSRPVVDRKQEPISQVMAKILNKSQLKFPCPESLPEEFPLEDAVQLCVLDPGFPRLVQRVEEVLEKHSSLPLPGLFNSYL